MIKGTQLTEFNEELERFRNKIDLLFPLVVDNIKQQVLEMHSRRYDYVKNTSSSQLVMSLDLNINITLKKRYLYSTNEFKGEASYYISESVIIENNIIIDGKVAWLVWQNLESKIDLNSFPNFRPPEFSDGKKVY